MFVNTNELTLKPCPFCGGEAILVKDFSSFKDWTYVRCQECGASVAVVDNPYRAIENWNRRVTDGVKEKAE